MEYKFTFNDNGGKLSIDAMWAGKAFTMENGKWNDPLIPEEMEWGAQLAIMKEYGGMV